MIILTEGITQALKADCEVSFKLRNDVGLGVVEMGVRKGDLHVRHCLDTLRLEDQEVFEEAMDRLIRWSVGEIELKSEEECEC